MIILYVTLWRYQKIRSVGIIRTARFSPPRIMPRHRQPTATAKRGRRFGLSASAPVQARLRSLPRPAPVSASVRRHPRPGERSSLRSGGSQPLLAALTTLPVCLGFAPTTQAETRQPFGAAAPSASTAPASFLAGGGSRLVADNRRPRHKKAAAVSLLRFTHGSYRAASHHLSPPSTPTHPITSRYVEVVRYAATARASPARPEGLHNEC